MVHNNLRKIEDKNDYGKIDRKESSYHVPFTASDDFNSMRIGEKNYNQNSLKSQSDRTNTKGLVQSRSDRFDKRDREDRENRLLKSNVKWLDAKNEKENIKPWFRKITKNREKIEDEKLNEIANQPTNFKPKGESSPRSDEFEQNEWEKSLEGKTKEERDIFLWEKFKAERAEMIEHNVVHKSSFLEFGAENISRDVNNCQKDLSFVYPDDYIKDAEYTKSGIAKILWRTGRDCNIPPHWIEGFCSGYLLKGWKLVYMTDEDNYQFVLRHYPELLPLYSNFKFNIQRVDLVRILYLHKFSGLYSDLDNVFLTDFSYFFEEMKADAFLVRSANIHSTITNSFMASPKGSPFWIEVINAIAEKKKPWYAVGRHLEVLYTTGPSLLTQVVRNTNSVVALLPGNYFQACNVCQVNCKSSVETGQYMRQVSGSSWLTWQGKFNLCVMCSWPQMIIIVILLVVLIYFTFFI